LLSSLLLSHANAADVVITKAQFLDAMKTGLANAFCADKTYFRKCFNVSEDECIKEALRSTKVCAASLESQIPEKLHQPDDGRKWGAEIGKCTGRTYELGLVKKKSGAADCKDAAKWKG
jgi:hypothetical protein